MSYKKEQYKRVTELINKSDVFNGDSGKGIYSGKCYPFVLQDEMNNLYSPIKDEVIEYFNRNKVAWWRGSKPTNHTLSSQIACINHLFPIRDDKDAVLAIAKHVQPDIVDVMIIETDAYSPSYIQFEAVSDVDHLNENRSTRGSNCTSVDALLYCRHKDGRNILMLIEWKYAESYSNENKADGDKGKSRKKSYDDLINSSGQLTRNSYNTYFYEPFYQLMRQTLWAEQMVLHKDEETIAADDYIHINVIPSDNNELLGKKYPCSGKAFEETWRCCLNDDNKYRLLTPQELLAPIDRERHSQLIKYLHTRYW